MEVQKRNSIYIFCCTVSRYDDTPSDSSISTDLPSSASKVKLNKSRIFYESVLSKGRRHAYQENGPYVHRSSKINAKKQRAKRKGFTEKEGATYEAGKF